MIKKFHLGTYEWKVKYRKNLKKGMLGWCIFESNKKEIHVATHDPETKKPLKEEDIERTFYHELTHAILFTMNSKIAEDEDFVNPFGDYLYQINKTKE